MTRRPFRFLQVLAVLALTLSGALHTETARADDVQVNSYTTAGQLNPYLAMNADGEFVVVWMSYASGGPDLSDTSIQGRLFDASGAPVGDDFQVNTYTSDAQASPIAFMEADGDFTVVWHGIDGSFTDGSGTSIQGQRYDSAGAPIGGQFQVNTYTTAYQYSPAVATDADGDFFLVWHSGFADSPDPLYEVRAQRYDASAAPLGTEFQINSYTSYSQFNSSIAAAPNGDFVVVWQSYGSTGSDLSAHSIQARRFASDGSPVGDDFQVNTYTTSDQRYPSIAMSAAGDFVVVWESYGSEQSDTDQFSIQGRRYDASGGVGGVFQINTYTTNLQIRPKISMDGDGNFVVAWFSYGSAGTDDDRLSIQSRRFSSDGSPLEDDFQVNTYTTSDQGIVSVDLDAEGNFIVAWTSFGSDGTDTDASSIQRSMATPLFAIFRDGFESGDTSAWSAVVD